MKALANIVYTEKTGYYGKQIKHGLTDCSRDRESWGVGEVACLVEFEVGIL